SFQQCNVLATCNLIRAPISDRLSGVIKVCASPRPSVSKLSLRSHWQTWRAVLLEATGIIVMKLKADCDKELLWTLSAAENSPVILCQIQESTGEQGVACQ
ncbi:hypothetical protein SFRURICE_000167, partial [Spodoptera frugiperda]